MLKSFIKQKGLSLLQVSLDFNFFCKVKITLRVHIISLWFAYYVWCLQERIETNSTNL